MDGAIVKRLKSGVALGAKKSHLCEVVDGGELVVELVVVWCCALLHFLSNGLLRGFSSSGWVGVGQGEVSHRMLMCWCG